jgi:hypothetical protein
MSMYKELGNVEGSRLPMTLVPVLAQVRVCPCAFPVSLKATAAPHPLVTHLCLTTNSRLTTTTPDTRTQLSTQVLFLFVARDSTLAAASSAPRDTACAPGQHTGISACTRHTAVAHCLPYYLAWRRRRRTQWELQLLEESECIHCPSFTGAVCSQPSPARS